VEVRSRPLIQESASGLEQICSFQYHQGNYRKAVEFFQETAFPAGQNLIGGEFPFMSPAKFTLGFCLPFVPVLFPERQFYPAAPGVFLFLLPLWAFIQG